MARSSKMDAGSALLSLRSDLLPDRAPTLEELRLLLAQCEGGGDGGCWQWTGRSRVRFRGQQWKPQRLFYTWFAGDLASNQRLTRTCDEPAPPKQKKKRRKITVTEPEPNVLDIRVAVTTKQHRNRRKNANRCANPKHQVARIRSPEDDNDESETTTTTSSSSAAGSDCTISVDDIEAMERAGRTAREGIKMLGLSYRQYRAAMATHKADADP